MTPSPESYIEVNTHWVSRAAFSLISAALMITQVALGFAYHYGLIWLCLPLAFLVSHFMHGLLIGFHEASHGLLRKNRFFNEFDGMLTGTMSLMSFTLYRAAHQKHHSHLATERDVELWPFVIVTSPRWQRRLVAFIELNAGILFTPFLFLRVFLHKDSFIRNKRVRRRIWLEYVLIAAVWTTIFTTRHLVPCLGLFLLGFPRPRRDRGQSPELAEIHRTRRLERPHRQKRDPQHRGQNLARPPAFTHLAARAVPRHPSHQDGTAA